MCDAQMTCSPGSPAASGVDRVNVRLQADQPVVPVPVYQDVYKRDKYIEVPTVELNDTIIPKVYNQSAVHEVPKMDIAFQEKDISVESEKIIDRDVEVPVLVGYAPQFLPKWDVREVPRPVPKYEGKQEVIEVEVPEIEYKDTYVEKEVVVDVKEKVVPKVTEVVKEVEVVQYSWKQQYQDVPVYKYVPKFDVELDCPPPMIIPYPETRFVKDAPDVVKPYCAPSMMGTCCPTSSPYHVIPSQRVFVRGVDGVADMERHAPMVTAGAFHSMSPGVQMQSDAVPSGVLPADFVTQGQLVGDAPGCSSQEQLPSAQLAPGPVFPMPSPQVENSTTHSAAVSSVRATVTRVPSTEKKGFWSWLFGKKETPEKTEEPKGVDYTAHFQQQHQQQLEQQGLATDRTDAQSAKEDSGSLEPSVVYKGVVNRPAVFGGNLNPISFKLHAIEIHQFIPLPNVRVPEFVKALPDGLMTTDVSGLDRFFGPVPTGWADPDVTGIPAPMMSDILAGNIHATTTSPLINELSQQFAKQDTSAPAQPQPLN
ncbi:alveolin domain containing intermediate filament IMC10 [Besnoitia besnoiti]|uniref:Alveolin domain containing intermediate filament IMC10 n=1 Tax=Besnoitia besnoiti TaxID=94643 RepID=A0A2A9MPS8_BESBE|nr:alveolin domain containing intermediate filament IMC10 [Besnoitia besnoiti]PFH38741.1 alveolin domain containing intermediate filament IMC10 [Besnoitia besnoiti]